jgi:hypothetical protein
MELPLTLQQDIVNSLNSLPNIHSSYEQQAFIIHAGLEPQLQKQLPIGDPSGRFVPEFVSMLKDYGMLADGRDALEAVLEAAKDFVGQEKRQNLDTLIQQLKTFRQFEKLPSLQKKIIDFFLSFPNIDDSNMRRALICSAGLDRELQRQIPIGKPRIQFVDEFVSVLKDYGLANRQDALEAVLEAAKDFVGQERRQYADALIQELKTFRQLETLSLGEKKDVRGCLKIYTLRGGKINEIINFLCTLQYVYEHLYGFDLKIKSLRQSTSITKTLSIIPNVRELILPKDTLFINKVNIASPGFWEILGNLNPLSQIREYLKERHERLKDKEWRNELERRKMTLENINFETDIVSKQIDLLKKADIPEEDIQRFVMRHYYNPLAKLNPYQDSGMIQSAELIDVKELPLESVIE